MKVYKTQQEVNADIKNGVLAIDGDVRFECSISIEASIVINKGNIFAGNITAWDITADNINSWDINAGSIRTGHFVAGNIIAVDIDAKNILCHALCFAYKSIKCISIKYKREIHQKPICLEGKLEIKGDVETITIGNNRYDKKEVEEALKNIKSLE